MKTDKEFICLFIMLGLAEHCTIMAKITCTMRRGMVLRTDVQSYILIPLVFMKRVKKFKDLHARPEYMLDMEDILRILQSPEKFYMNL